MSASAEAMNRFMLALLQGGKLNGKRILQATTLEEMLSREFVHDPRLNAMTLGFYEMNSHGLRILGHGGGTSWFFNDMAIIPEEDLGIFVSFNSPGGALLSIGKFRQALLDRFYSPGKENLIFRQKTEAGIEAGKGQEPATTTMHEREVVTGREAASEREATTDREVQFERETAPKREVAPGWEDRAKAYEGVYLSFRRSFTTFEKPLGMAMGRVSVEAGDHGEIITRSMMGTHRGREVEPGFFRAAEGHAKMAFRGSPEEGYTHLYLSDIPPMTFERQRFRDSAGLHLGLLLYCFLFFLTLPVIMVMRYGLQLRFTEITPLHGPERWLRWIGMAFVLQVLLFLVLLLAAIGDQAYFMAGEGESLLRIALVFPVLSVPLAFVLAGGAVYAIRQRLWNRWSRAWFILFALAALIYLIELHYWNLLGWNI